MPNPKSHESGRRLPLVLLHGFGEDARIWSDQAVLEEEITVFRPNLPGSGGVPAPKEYSMESLAEGLRQQLDDADIYKCILAGHSMGGYVALAFAERWPERLAGLGLIHSTAFADTEVKREARRKGIDFVRRQGRTAFLRTTIPGLYSDKSREESPGLVEKHLSEADGAGDDAIVGYYEAMMARPDRTAVLKGSQIPFLFVLGRHDNAVSLADGLRQCYLPSVSRVYLLEEAGHMGMRECSGRMNRLLLDFVHFVNQRTAPE